MSYVITVTNTNMEPYYIASGFTYFNNEKMCNLSTQLCEARRYSNKGNAVNAYEALKRSTSNLIGTVSFNRV